MLSVTLARNQGGANRTIAPLEIFVLGTRNYNSFAPPKKSFIWLRPWCYLCVFSNPLYTSKLLILLQQSVCCTLLKF